MKLHKQNRELAIPGELLAEGDFLLGEGTFSEGGKIFANILGLVDTKEQFIKLIPLSGKYVPAPRDLVIGIVEDIAFSSWSIDVNSPYKGILGVANATERFIDIQSEDLSKIYDMGDVVLAKVINVSQSMQVGLTMRDRGLFKLRGGRLISINPTRVPRVIGKKGTMVQMLKLATGCKIVVGQNGRIWIDGENPNIAIEAIKLIESEAHVQGLTERVRSFLEEKTHKKIAEIPLIEETGTQMVN
ncbi:TPA: RNA-binding protein [archaeon]|nr:RNA-binding protein [Candidatus Naiadarchaeales archaeon SRR2090153.bin461]